MICNLQENNPPDGYNKQKIDRPKSGVLTPAQGIECTPIEEQVTCENFGLHIHTQYTQCFLVGFWPYFSK